MDIRSINAHTAIPVAPTKIRKKDGKTSSFADSLASDTDTALETTSVPVLFAVDPLFADMGKSNKQAAIASGLKVLDELDRLQAMLLRGGTAKETIATLVNIKQAAKNLSKENIPEELNDILLEIETRAEVELAKAHYF